MARATRLIAVLAVAVLTFGAAAAGAQEAPATKVEDLTAAAGADGIKVSGKGVFSAAAIVVGEDAAGDGALPGSDLTSASITQISQNQIRFELGVDDLPPVVGGTPEILNYTWPLEVAKGSAVTTVDLQAWRTSTGADLLCDVVFSCPGQEPGGSPRFSVNTCAPDPTTGNNTCNSVGVPGEFTATGLAWMVPTSMINAKDGATLNPSEDIASSYGASGLTWNTAGTGGDTMTWNSVETVPATVQIGLAPADTPEGDVATTLAVPVNASSGKFTGTLPSPSVGSYRVVAKACLGSDNCGLGSQVVTIP